MFKFISNKNKIKTKFYNLTNNTGYAPLTKLSPYSKISYKRLKNTKFVFRKANEYVKFFLKKPQTWLDVGTANGEFIHFLSQQSAKTKFIGLDIEDDFLNVARSINKNRENVIFFKDDILHLKQKNLNSDVVTCLGTIQIFPDPTKFLNKVLDLVNKKGICVVEGNFNVFDVSAQILFKDDTKKIAEGIWRCDFNLHSEKWIRKILSKRSDIKKIYFKRPVMDTKIPKKKDKPNINDWTIPLKNNGYKITNGLKMDVSPSFLIIKKK